MYPENLEGTRAIVNSMNMRFVSDTARTRNLFHPKWTSIPLGHSDGQIYATADNSKFTYGFV